MESLCWLWENKLLKRDFLGRQMVSFAFVLSFRFFVATQAWHYGSGTLHAQNN